MKLRSFIRTWKLPIAMTLGVLVYLGARLLPLSADSKLAVYDITSHIIQPVLLFSMLFLSFLKVRPSQLRPVRWHWVLLGTQVLCILLCAGLAILIRKFSPSFGITAPEQYVILAQGAMLAFICPTATAGAVITDKLGGSVSGIVTYLLLCNLMVSFVAPAILPWVEPQSGLHFTVAFFMILGKVFPLLLCPLMLAWLVRFTMPRLHNKLLSYPDLAFDLWMPALALAIAVTVRSIVHSNVDIWILTALALISCVSCVMQFALGKLIGRPSGNSITAGQSFGQKNTVFIIWMGLVFLNPVTSVVGGFYSVWHNIINSIQLAQHAKQQQH